jgi:ABC-type spermidine/putrescine transport system permease subunit II
MNHRIVQGVGRALYWAVLLLTLAFLIVPAVLVVVLSFSNEPTIAFPPRGWGMRNYVALGSSPGWWRAAMLSLVVATVVAVISALVAVPAAFAVERTGLARLPVLSFLAVLPLLVPQAAYSIGVYMMMVQLGMLGSPAGLVAAHVAICFPLVFVIVRSQLKRMSPDLDLVAMTLGASRRRAWLGISLRLLLPTVLSGGLFAFLISFDEAVFSNFLSGGVLITLPKMIFDSVRLGIDPVITAIATLLMAFTALMLFTAAGLRRRKAVS